MTATALIADDEPELLRELERQLRLVWPDLGVIHRAGDGREALRMLAELRPDVAFLDIKMPGLSGLDVARQLPHPCHVVFVTAYDQYAVEAFEREALDYLLKPVREERLLATVERLRRRLEAPAAGSPDLAALLARVSSALEKPPEPYLEWLQASVGERIRLIAVAEVLYLRAEDKYTVIYTAEGQYPIRTPLKELETRLDPRYFWRIHRNCIVNVRQIHSITRDFRGRLNLSLHASDETLSVSRGYAEKFRQM